MKNNQVKKTRGFLISDLSCVADEAMGFRVSDKISIGINVAKLKPAEHPFVLHVAVGRERGDTACGLQCRGRLVWSAASEAGRQGGQQKLERPQAVKEAERMIVRVWTAITVLI